MITDANPRAAELLGLPRDSLVGRAPRTETGTEDNLAQLARLAIPDFEKKLLTLDKPSNELEVSQVPLHEESYRKTGTLHILHDVTAERRAEYLKTNFVSTATHQLRTPLTGLNWALDTLISSENMTEEKRDKLLEQMQHTTKYVISLINDLLNVSEIEEGRVQYDFKRQSVAPILRAIAEELQVEVGKKHINFVLDLPDNDEAAAAVVDRTRMTLALQNIMDNAVRYTPENGSVTVRVTPSPNTLLISVTDTGIGISKEDQELLFNKFFRAANAVRAVPDGSGLGLFLTKGIVEDHSGRIWVDSAPEKGSTFYVQLPLDEAMLPQQKTAAGDN